MRKSWVFVGAAGMVLALQNTAKAQILGLEPPEATVPERQSVAQRAHPEYDPVGARLGEFFFFPSAEVEETWNSNVFASQSGVKSDFFTSVRPGAALLSNFGTNQLNVVANGEVRRYAMFISENQTNYSILANGRYDITNGSFLSGGLGFQNSHEDRTAPSTLTTQIRPTEYQEASGKLKYQHDRGKLGFSVDGNVDYYSFDNTITGNGTQVQESDRNRIDVYGGPRLSYEIVPGYHAFIRTQLNDRIYQSTFDSTGLKRSSHGFEGDIGTAFEVTRVINGEAFIGYLQQDYDDARLSGIHGIGFGGNLLWNVTQATSIRANVARTVQEVDLFATPGASSVTAFLQTQLGVSVEHELRENILLTGGASYTIQDFQNITRTDDIAEADLGVKYMLNRNWSTGLDASFQSRFSNVAGQSYNRALIGVKVRGQF